MTLPADFTIDADPSANLGYDASNSQVLTLQLETPPTTDVGRVVFSVAAKSKGADDLVFSPVSGEPTTPGGSVDTTMPATGVHSYIVRCQVNNGVDSNGKVVAGWTTHRLVAIRSPKDLRKMVPVERTEYEAPDGWTGAFNEMVDYLETLNIIEGGLVDDDLEVTGDLVVGEFITPTVPASVFATTVADMNDVPVTGTSFHVEIDEPGGDLTGFAGGANGRLLIVSVVSGGGGFVLKHEDAGSSAANRLVHPGSRDVVMDAGMTVVYQYATGRWRLLGHAVPAFGELYVSTPAATAIVAVDTPIKIAGTTTLVASPAAVDFSMPADNRLRYDGPGTIVAQVTVRGTLVSGTSTNSQILVAKNGSVIASSAGLTRTSTSYAAASSSAFVELANGDYVEAWIENLSNDVDVTLDALHMAALKVA